VVDDRDAVAEALRFVHVVRGEQNRAPRRLELLDELPDLPPRLRVESRRRLVEEEQLRIADDGARERQTLLLSAGQLPDARGPFLVKLDETDNLGHAAAARVEAAKESHRLFDGELLGELSLLQLNAEQLTQCALVVRPTTTEDDDVSFIGAVQPLANLDRRRLPGTVGSQQAEAFSGGDLEIETVDGDDVAIALPKPAHGKRYTPRIMIGNRHYQNGLFVADGSLIADSLRRIRTCGILPGAVHAGSVERVTHGGAGMFTRSPRPVPRFSVRVASLLVAIAALVASRARAQDATTWRGVIFGTVKDSTGARLAAAQIVVLTTGIQTVSDDSGTFRLTGLPAGRVTVEVRRLGYAVSDLAVTLADGEARELGVVLAAAAAALERVDVKADATRGKMGGFNMRRVRGIGTFITREEIERRHPGRTSQLLSYVSGLYVQQENSDMRPSAVGMRRSAGISAQSNCVVQLYVDGQHYPDGRIDDFRPVEVEGLEIYKSASEIPAVFRSRDTMCGLIAIWTRDPSAARR